jgi:hypothetical protein
MSLAFHRESDRRNHGIYVLPTHHLDMVKAESTEHPPSQSHIKAKIKEASEETAQESI